MISYRFIRCTNSGRRDALDKSQRTDGESTVTGSSTPSANSSSSLSSVGQDTGNHVDHSLSNSHNLASTCPIITTGTSNHSPPTDLSPGIQSDHSPNYSQQPLALTMNSRLNNNKSLSTNTHFHKETFPINPVRQHLMATSNSSHNPGPYLKL
jgi:hypothetical protein